jgi:hypothetical protein
MNAVAEQIGTDTTAMSIRRDASLSYLAGLAHEQPESAIYEASSSFSNASSRRLRGNSSRASRRIVQTPAATGTTTHITIVLTSR